MKRFIAVVIVALLVVVVTVPVHAASIEGIMPTQRLNEIFNVGQYSSSETVPAFINKVEQIGNGMFGKVSLSSEGVLTLFTWRNNTGSRNVYKWNGSSWEFVKTITGIVKGFEEPATVVNNKETVWALYLHEIVGDMNGTSVSDVVVDHNGLHLTLNGPSKVEVNTGMHSYSAHVTGGQSPYVYAWTGEGYVSESETTAQYSWTTVGTYVVTVGVKDSNGNSVLAHMNVQVVPKVSVTISGSSQLSKDEKGNYVAHISDGISPYTVRWSSNGKYSSVGTGSVYWWHSKGTYTITVTVTDAENVTATGNKQVTITDPLSVSISGPTRLKKDTTGIFNAIATGGTGTYTYQWGYGVPPTNNSSTQKSSGSSGSGNSYTGGGRKHILPYEPNAFNTVYPEPIYMGMIGPVHSIPHTQYPPPKTIQPVPPTPVRTSSAPPTTVATPQSSNSNNVSTSSNTSYQSTSNNASHSTPSSTHSSTHSNTQATTMNDAPMYNHYEGSTATFSWSSVGYHTIWVKVTDSNGDTAIAIHMVQVYNVPVPPPHPYNPPDPNPPTPPDNSNTTGNDGTAYAQVVPVYDSNGNCISGCAGVGNGGATTQQHAS